MGEVDGFSRDIVKDRHRLYWEDFKRIPSLFPSPEEQWRIVAGVDSATRTLSQTIEQAQREVPLVREYRTRL